jgi:DnaJ family protein C protein 8
LAQKFVVLQLKEIEKRDSVLTSKQQILRLLKPGSTYLNLNPFDVLQLEHTVKVEEIKKKYKKLSLLLHPDKNIDDKERAQSAFEIVNKAWKILENDVTRKKCLDLYEEAQQRTDIMIAEKRKKLKKEGKSERVPEDEGPAAYNHAVYVTVMKLFAEQERRRQQLDVRDMEERKRKREQEIEEEEAKKMQQEYAKNFEESREARVSSWQKFQSGEGSKKKKKKTTSSGFAPPKVKQETRH